MVKVFPLAPSVFSCYRCDYLSAALVSKHRGYPSTGIDQESFVYWTASLFVPVLVCIPVCPMLLSHVWASIFGTSSISSTHRDLSSFAQVLPAKSPWVKEKPLPPPPPKLPPGFFLLSPPPHPFPHSALPLSPQTLETSCLYSSAVACITR